MNNEWSKTYCKVKYITYAIFTILVLINVRIGWVLFYPYRPIEVKYVKILDSDQILHPGEKLTYEVEFTKTMELPATVSRSLVNNIIVNFPSFTSYMPMGHKIVRDFIDLPSFIDTDHYKLVLSFDYVVSDFPKRTVRYRAESNLFEVRKGEETRTLIRPLDQSKNGRGEILSAER